MSICTAAASSGSAITRLAFRPLGYGPFNRGPEFHIGIAGQNMNLVAKSLGLGFCWSGFSRGVNFVPGMPSRLGFGDQWTIHTAVTLGYPKFKQKGIVPRHYRPVTWFRPGSSTPEIEE